MKSFGGAVLFALVKRWKLAPSLTSNLREPRHRARGSFPWLRNFLLALLLGLVGCGRHPVTEGSPAPKRVVGPAVAGMFYPQHEKDLTCAGR